jgi:hypothetical protein
MIDFASVILWFRPDSTHLTGELVEINDAIGDCKYVSLFHFWTQYLGINAPGNLSVPLALKLHWLQGFLWILIISGTFLRKVFCLTS